MDANEFVYEYFLEQCYLIYRDSIHIQRELVRFCVKLEAKFERELFEEWKKRAHKAE